MEASQSTKDDLQYSEADRTELIQSITKYFSANILFKAYRRLTVGERNFLKTVFYDTVDYDRIKIQKGLFVKVSTDAMTMDNSISFREEVYLDDFSIDSNLTDLALLAHEVGHVWQYQNLHYGWLDSLLEHLWYRDHVYDYVPKPTKVLTDYRFEQQGKIIQDYVEQHPDRDLLEKIIYGSIARP